MSCWSFYRLGESELWNKASCHHFLFFLSEFMFSLTLFGVGDQASTDNEHPTLYFFCVCMCVRLIYKRNFLTCLSPQEGQSFVCHTAVLMNLVLFKGAFNWGEVCLITLPPWCKPELWNSVIAKTLPHTSGQDGHTDYYYQTRARRYKK